MADSWAPMMADLRAKLLMAVQKDCLMADCWAQKRAVKRVGSRAGLMAVSLV
jgi:hypothetical protein